MKNRWKMASDEELLQGWFAGDQAAFETFFSRHAGRVYGYAVKKGLGNEADDVVQLVFIKLHKNIGKYDTERPALPWFFSLVHNICMDELRTSQRSAGRVVVSSSDMERVSKWHQQEREGNSDSEEWNEQFERLGVELRQLKPEQQAVIEMRVQQELSFKEISAATGKTEISLRKAYQRAVELLRSHVIGGEGT